MLSESFGGVLGELDRPPALSGLGGAYEELSAVLRDRAPYRERLLFYVHVFPAQRQKFALPEAGMQGHHVESFQTVAPDDLQEPSRFVAGERMDFFGVSSWRVHVVGWVLRHVYPPHGLLQGLVQRLVHLVNRRGAASGIQPGAVEARHVRRTQGLELFSAQRGYQVNPT